MIKMTLENIVSNHFVSNHDLRFNFYPLAIHNIFILLYIFIKRLPKYHGLKKELEMMWKMKAKIIPVVHLGLFPLYWKSDFRFSRFQKQEISIQKSALPGIAKILHGTSRFSRPAVGR